MSGIKDLREILQQIHEPDEFRMTERDSKHPLYHIFSLDGAQFKDLKTELREYRPEHARFDIFINGQWILEQDYILEQDDKDILVKFIKENFSYTLDSDDKITIKGDIQIDD